MTNFFSWDDWQQRMIEREDRLLLRQAQRRMAEDSGVRYDLNELEEEDCVDQREDRGAGQG